MAFAVPKVVRAGMQSGSIMFVADIFTQSFVERKSGDDEARESLDLLRSTRWALAGLLIHGPYFYAGFRRVDAYFANKSALLLSNVRIVVYKTSIAQFILFPPYLVALFSYMGYMEGVPSRSDKVKACVPSAFYGGCVFWPFANGLNFAIVPSTLRVPYLALSAGVWNSYLSWTNAKRR